MPLRRTRSMQRILLWWIYSWERIGASNKLRAALASTFYQQNKCVIISLPGANYIQNTDTMSSSTPKRCFECLMTPAGIEPYHIVWAGLNKNVHYYEEQNVTLCIVLHSGIIDKKPFNAYYILIPAMCRAEVHSCSSVRFIHNGECNLEQCSDNLQIRDNRRDVGAKSSFWTENRRSKPVWDRWFEVVGNEFSKESRDDKDPLRPGHGRNYLLSVIITISLLRDKL